MASPIIAVDVDDVVADLISEWLRRYNSKYDDHLTPENIHSWEVDEYVKPECGPKVFDLLRAPGFYGHVKPFEGALEAVENLRKLGRVVFLTSCVPKTMDMKLAWLQEHGFLPKGNKGAQDFIACRDKYLVNADVLIDDRILNVEEFKGHALLIKRPHNARLQCSRKRITLAEAPGEVANHLWEMSRVSF